MKQITPEIKARVFALYWGQEILAYKHWGQIVTGNEIDCWALSRNENYLEVKPLSSITDEDAIEVCRLGHDDRGDEKYKAESGKALLSNYIRSNHCNVRGEWWIEIADYLRSRGYALPYMDWSVDELVGAGVFKIKEVNNE